MAETLFAGEPVGQEKGFAGEAIGQDKDFPIAEELDVQPQQTQPLPNLNYYESTQAWRDTLSMADELGIDPDTIDVDSGAKFLDRLDYSLSDTDAEVTNKFLQKYPKGVMLRVGTENGSRLLYKENSTTDLEMWKTVEDYNLSFGDLADLGGAAIPTATSIGLGLLSGGSSIPIQMLAYGGGYLLGYTGKEAVEELRGTQLEPFKETAARGLKETGITAGFTGLAGLAGKGMGLATGRGVIQRSPETMGLVQDVAKARGKGTLLKPLSVSQQAPESMVLSRLEAQARAASKSAQQSYLKQFKSTKEELQAAKGIKLSAYKSNKVMQREAGRIYRKELNELRNKLGRIEPREAAKAGVTGLKDWQKSYKNQIGMQYRALDDIANTERPIFNLRTSIDETPSVRETAEKVRDFLLAQTDEGSINVAGVPTGQLKSVVDDIVKISDEQLDYNVLKQLRTRTGEVIEQWPWDQNLQGAQAKMLYKSLTQNIENPINKAPHFVSAHSQVSSKARAYYESLSSPSIRTLLKKESTSRIVKTFSNPDNITDNVIDAMSSPYHFPAAKLVAFKKGVRQQLVLSEKGAVKALDDFKSSGKDTWKFIVPKNEERRLYKIAEDFDSLKNSTLGNIVRENGQNKNIVNDLMTKRVSRAEINSMASKMTPRGREATRAAIYEDILDKSGTTIKGVPTVDKAKLGDVINEYKNSGIWESRFLTSADRTRIQGVKSYMELLLYRGKDPGVSLETAQMITELKHPATIVSGLHKLTMNAIIAKILTSDTGARLIVGTGKEALKTDPLIATGLILKALAEGTELGSGGAQMPEVLPRYGQYSKRK